MFTLSIPTEPRWVDLPLGVRVKIKPMDVLVITAARQHAARELRRMRADRAERIEVGAPIADLLDLDDDILAETITRMEFARGLARYGIIAFEGVGNEAGTEALPFTQANAQALVLHQDLMEPFLMACLAPVTALAAEGNGSATGPNGSTDPVASTADPAQASAPTAPGSQTIQ
jgi:hypothetical protein